MKNFLLIVCCCCIQHSIAQTKLSGKVIDSISKQPLAGMNVFLSNTSIGAITDEKGEFIIQHIPAGKFELIASSLNYETYITTIQSFNTPLLLTIPMKPISNNLKEVVVESYDRDGWAKYGDYFKTHFIGSAFLSKDCKLLNPDILHFRLNTKTKKVRAFAHEKLIFENKALGYKISYVLTKFEFDIDNNIFQYIGYPLFENLVPVNTEEQKKWDANKAAVYHGSLMHFMRSLYNDRLTEDGFEVKAMKKVSDEENQRVRKLYKQMDDNAKTLLNKDSAEYFLKVRNLSSSDDTVILSRIIPRDEVVFPIDASVEPDAVLLEFDGYLHITYLHKKEPSGYTRLLAKRPEKDFISSDISLPFQKGVSVFKNGRFFFGGNIFFSGYWAWSEKLSTMLPSDYLPEEK